MANPLLDETEADYADMDQVEAYYGDANDALADDRDGTEWIVGAIVLGALGVLTGFLYAGFRAVVTVGRS